MTHYVTLALLLAIAPPAYARELHFDPARSWIVGATHRAGLLGLVGHEHAIEAEKWTARASYDPKAPEAAKIEVTAPLAAFSVDEPKARARARLESSGPGDSARVTVRAKMLGAGVLNAAEHPEIAFHSTAARASGKGLAIEGTIEICGITRPVHFQADVESRVGKFAFRGAIPVRLPDFGISPAGVSDAMQIYFDLSE